MNPVRLIWALLCGKLDETAYDDYRRRILDWAAELHGLTRAEFRGQYENRYLDASGRDLFLDYLVSCAKEQPSYVTDHPGLLADRKALFDRFGHPILTMHELVEQENRRLSRMDSPLRL
ncbi:hypothetical protein RAS1_32970 [Phycisphaerae bacterium RAS1]|nr:hypothetical protein RAS1_32970 [Phycisphaerae bacterium RAS1]